MELAELQIRLAFELLDEVAVPVQPASKPASARNHSPRSERRAFSSLAPAAALHHLTQRQGSPGEVGREARATGEGGARAGQLPVVASAPRVQETLRTPTPPAAPRGAGPGQGSAASPSSVAEGINRDRDHPAAGRLSGGGAIGSAMRAPSGAPSRCGHPTGGSRRSGGSRSRGCCGSWPSGPPAGRGRRSSRCRFPRGSRGPMPNRRRARSSTCSAAPILTTSGWPSPARARRRSSRLSVAEGPLPGRGITLLPQLRFHHHQRQHRAQAGWPAAAAGDPSPADPA
jgi:hypothetical protein